MNSPVTTPVACFNGGGITPPLCHCGRRTRRRVVINPGPTQEELSLHALLVMGEQLLMEMQIERSLKVVVNFFVGRSVYKRVQSKDILMRMVLMLRCSRG